MSIGRDAVGRRLVRLFGEGTVAGLTERQLLDRFVARRDEVAFEAILNRHGPMVLGVCRRAPPRPPRRRGRLPGDVPGPGAAGRTIRDGELLAPWLHKVARRVAARAGIEAARRRPLETKGVDGLADPSPAASDFIGDLRPAIDEELGRLPEKYRKPVVLCYLEGKTHEEAAGLLKWPVGTVKGRLSRARDLLRVRLARRGLAPTAGLLAACSTLKSNWAVSEDLTARLFHSAKGIEAGGALATGTVPAAVTCLVESVLRTMLMNKLRALALGLLAFGALAVGADAVARQFGGGLGLPPSVPNSKAGEANEPGSVKNRARRRAERNQTPAARHAGAGLDTPERIEHPPRRGWRRDRPLCRRGSGGSGSRRP